MLLRRKKSAISIIVLVLLLSIQASPFFLMLVGAFKPNMALIVAPPDINPFDGMTIANLLHVINNSDIFTWIKNSFIISFSVALITMFIAAAAGYAFSKIKFRFSGALFAVIIATMILPKQLLLIPNYLVADSLGLTNSYIGIILTSISAPFGIFLCRQFMQNIPGELTEAAEIDGCSELGKFIRLILPMSLPALGALGIFAFFNTYNDYLWQLIMISDKKLQTVPIGIAMFAQQHVSRIGYQLMAASIATVPLLILFILCQKFFIKGITMGGVKG